jgi:hypothetical protein
MVFVSLNVMKEIRMYAVTVMTITVVTLLAVIKEG